jgi:arylsulfatase
MKRNLIHNGFSLLIATAALFGAAVPLHAVDKKANILMLMQDDTGRFDFGCYGGGASLGHPTPNVDRMAKEGARFTCWYGQASCTAGPLLVHDRTHSDPFSLVRRRRTGR